MIKIISILIVCLILPVISFADIEAAKSQCKELGFEPGTEKYADCVMKLLPEKNTKKNQPNIDEAINQIDKNKENEFQFSLIGLSLDDAVNTFDAIQFYDGIRFFIDMSYSRAYGFYKGEAINGIPNGKGKWSNCYEERYIKIVEELDLVRSLTKKYHANEINVDDYINEILDNDVKFLMSPEYISSNKMASGLYFDLTNGDKGEPRISNSEPCEVIVGTWKNGGLNGYAKIFSLGEPNTIPNLENLWSDIDINTNYLSNPFGKHVKIWIRKFENDVAIEDLNAKISVNQGQGILSSLDENGYPDGLGFIYLADGSNLMVNFKNGEIDYDQNIIGFFNNEKNKPNYNSKDIGNILEKNIDFFKENKSELYLTLAKNNLKDKDRPSFIKQSSFLKKRDNFKKNLYNFNNKLIWIDTNSRAYGLKPNFPNIFDGSNDMKPYTYYRGKTINEKGKLIYNGKGILIRYTGQEIRYNEGEFKNNVFVEGYQLLDKGSQYQIRANKNINFQSERQQVLNHTSELYLGSLNEFGPNGKGTMIMPYGMVYVGEWKDNNFHGKGEIRKYENKKITIKEKGSAAKKTIPNLRYSLKGNFSKGTFEGDMEGYIYEAKFDAADVITDIVKKDISGLYSKGKLVKSSVVKKVEAKKLDRPVFKPEGDPTQAIIQAENLAAKIGCIGHQMEGIFGKFLIYPCATYDDYEEAMKNNGASKLEEFKKEKVLKTNSSMFKNISNDTNESFYVDDVKVTKFQNPNKINQQDFVISKCRIQKLNNLKKNEIYFNETVYIIDINNLSIKRIRKNKKDDSLEEKIFPITTIISPFNALHVQYFDDEKMNFVAEYKSEEIREFVNKSKNSKKLEFRSIKEMRIAFDMTSNDMKQYTLALSDESIFLNIPKSGSINVETRFGFTPYAFGMGKDRTAVIDPMDKGSQIIESCAKLETDKKIEIAKKDIANKNIKGTIENYHQAIKDSGLVSFVDFGLEGEEEPYFSGYEKNISGTVNGEPQGDTYAQQSIDQFAEDGIVMKMYETKFKSVFKCKNPYTKNFDLYFYGRDENLIRFEQTRLIKEKYQKYYSELPVYHLIRFSSDIDKNDKEKSYSFYSTYGAKKNQPRFDLITSSIYYWKDIRNNKLPKSIIAENITEDIIEISKDLTKFKDWKKRFKKGYLIKQNVKLNLKTNSIYYKHLKYFSNNSSDSWYKEPEEIEYTVNCERINL